MMFSPLTRGRPSRSFIDNLERQVARTYDNLQKSHTELMAVLVKQYSTLSSFQLAGIKHTIFAIGEEYRAWSEIDNLLLTVQRNIQPIEKLDDSKHVIYSQFELLFDMYTLYRSTRQKNDVFSVTLISLPCNVTPASAKQYLIDNVATMPMEAQTHSLEQLSHTLQKTLQQATSIEDVKIIKTWIRAILAFILNHRLSLVYNESAYKVSASAHASKSNVGRPPIPLPIHYLRNEQELLDKYQLYETLCYEYQRPSSTPRRLWEQFVKSQKNTIGRPKLTEKQKINKTLKQKKMLLSALNDLPNAENLEIHTEKSTRGRKPLTIEMKKERLFNEIETLEQNLFQH